MCHQDRFQQIVISQSRCIWVGCSFASLQRWGMWLLLGLRLLWLHNHRLQAQRKCLIESGDMVSSRNLCDSSKKLVKSRKTTTYAATFFHRKTPAPMWGWMCTLRQCCSICTVLCKILWLFSKQGKTTFYNKINRIKLKLNKQYYDDKRN